MSALRKTIVLHSNLIVSAFLNPEGAASQAMQIALDYFDVAASKETLTELVDVLSRDKKHLNSMHPYQGLPIIGVREFIEFYQRYL
jgi:predicted nucleic acid-binding protein